MPLRKSPLRTAALLAANRANARKSTGPRTPQGKARGALNALKHGRCAASLPQALLRSGQDKADYRWFRAAIEAAFCPAGATTEGEKREVERLAIFAWSQARLAAKFGTKPESPLFSMGKTSWDRVRMQIRITDRWRRVGVVFWLPRRKFWTLPRLFQVICDGWAPPFPPSGSAWQERWRQRIYRLPAPTPWERMELENENHRQGRTGGGEEALLLAPSPKVRMNPVGTKLGCC